jgi:cytochrome c(L)
MRREGRVFGLGAMRSRQRTRFRALAALLLLSLAAAAGLHAGATTKNPYEGKPAAIREGEAIFDARCADCHGGDAMGQSGPDLTDDKWIYGGSDADVFETVANGRKGGMPSWRSELVQDDIWKVIAYIRSLKKK